MCKDSEDCPLELTNKMRSFLYFRLHCRIVYRYDVRNTPPMLTARCRCRTISLVTIASLPQRSPVYNAHVLIYTEIDFDNQVKALNITILV